MFFYAEAFDISFQRRFTQYYQLFYAEALEFLSGNIKNIIIKMIILSSIMVEEYTILGEDNILGNK
jgi:hypothetical protein